jgi:hypothetical protein
MAESPPSNSFLEIEGIEPKVDQDKLPPVPKKLNYS